MKTRSLPALLLTVAALCCGSSAFAKNTKVDVCHVTGSATNPGVVLNVSSKAVAAHVGHGDPLDYELLPDGSCQAETEPPIEIVELTACSKLDSSTASYSWAVNYYPATGVFDGISSGGTGDIDGTITPSGDIWIAGKGAAFAVDELTAVSRGPSFLDPSNSENMLFPITLNLVGGTLKNTYLVFAEADALCMSR